jgi:transposase, IS5 family
MLKCMMLAKWFNLSDPGLEDALKDRISFRTFVGLSFTDDTPEGTTFVTFRKRLREANLDDYLFQSVVKHLDSQGFLVREGTMVDATIIEQAKGSKNDEGENTRDEDASFTKKHGTTYCGYKAHFACDLSGIVTDYRFTTAKEHDSKRIDELVEDEDKAVLADSAYASRARREALQARGVIDAIIYKRHRGQPRLADWHIEWNRIVSNVRAGVEHPFAMMKHPFGHRKARYRGLERNGFDMCLVLMACNLKRSLWLRSAQEREPVPKKAL